MVSYDLGNSWQATGESRKGSLIAQGSSLCPEPTFDGKFRATYTGGTTTYSAACDVNTTLESGDTRPSGYDYTAMTSAEIGSCITSLGDYAFRYCESLTSCTIGRSVTTIGERAFQGCSGLTSVGIPDSVTSIGDYAFNNCTSLTTCTIGSGVTSIGGRAFQGCSSLTSVTIPDSVTSIGNSAFRQCYSLTSVTIPSGVTTIGGYAFINCTGLTSVTVNAVTPPTLGSNAFDNTPIASGIGYIYVPSDSLNSYKQASGWSTYASRIQAIQ